MATTELDRRRHASLELLKPICISLMKDATKEKVRALNDALAEVDNRIAQKIQQYILFPVQTRLRLKDLPDALLCELCDVVTVVFQKTAIASLSAFFDTFNPLMFILTPKDGSARVVFEFEETKTAVIKALMQLLKATQEIILCKIYCAEFIPAIGQLVSILLTFAELEKSRSVQRLALDCLLEVLQAHSKFGKKYEAQLAEFFPFCLPGVTMATSRIATGDTKQGYSVIVKSMEVFGKVVTLVMQDKSLENIKAGSSTTNEQQMQKLQPIRHRLHLERSEEWVKTTASKVKILVERLCKLVSHDTWRVRLGLAELCEEMLESCSRSLSESVSRILETLVGLINDPYGNVAKKATGALQAYSAAAESGGGAGGRTLMEILEENLHRLASSLPRQIRMCDEEEKPALIRLLNGYIYLLGWNISCVVNSSPHLSRLCLALVQALELEAKDLRIVEERGGQPQQDPEMFVGGDQSTRIWRPRKFFKHFRDELILSELLLACRQLGQYGNIHTLVDHLLDVCQSSATYRLASTLVINEMVLGAGSVDESNHIAKAGQGSLNDKILPDVISLLLEEYLSQENLRLLDNISDSSAPASTMAAPSLSSALVVVGADRTGEGGRTALNRNQAILQMCLHMEGLAKFAKVLGQNRQEHLIRTLYSLVENLGHENLYISSTAYAALVEVAVAGGYRTLDALLRENADYLVSSVSLRLRHFQLNRRTPQTLCVMLRYCSKELLPHMQRSVTQFLDSLDENYTEHLVLYMPVLLELVRAVSRWFPSNPTALAPASSGGVTSHTGRPTKNSYSEPHNLLQCLLDHLETKRVAEGSFREEDCSAETMTLDDIEREMKARAADKKEIPEELGEVDDEEKEKEVPLHVVVVKEVFLRVRNLLSTKNGRLRVQALDVVSQGIQCLRQNERELLPQVHQLWAGFRPLFHSQEKFIVVKAVKTLLQMSEAAGDFLRQRTMKEVLPGLSSFMEKQARISCDCHSGYLHTANYKLQICVLSTLGPLATNLQLDKNHLDQVARLCVPYLSDSQPQSLQEASVESFSNFVSLDPDAVWLLLTYIYSPWLLKLPSPEFVSVQVPAQANVRNSFSSNIAKIFHTHYSEDLSDVPTP